MKGGEKKRILIVDDERMIADTLSVVFSFNGYLARAAYSSEQALATAPEWRPDLAIIDMYLPGINGVELAAALRTRYWGMRIVLFSGRPDAADVVRAAGHSFEVLIKPVHPSEMLRTAARMLGQADESNYGQVAS
jgi:DNA-binding response OmpR family regulator